MVYRHICVSRVSSDVSPYNSLTELKAFQECIIEKLIGFLANFIFIRFQFSGDFVDLIGAYSMSLIRAMITW
jgi:hypothetical protein